MYNKPFIVSQKKGETFIKYYSGKKIEYNLLNEIDENKEQIFVVPFCQAKERDFAVRGNEKIISILVEEKKEFDFDEFSKTFEEKPSILGDLKEHFSRQEYEKIVENIVKKEIGNGEGANFLVAQKVEGKIKDFDIEVALSIFKRLLKGDYGTYLHFIFFDGEKIFIGASPERNVSVSKEGIVRMNPISGTFKKIGYKNYLDFKKDFKEFLKDKKEINELFMATDEELKMMSQICSSGGMIVGPILKEMANLVHTEYLLSGKSDLGKIDILRKSMWASTVIGSPIESAFRVAYKYENFSRKYYAGAICHINKDFLDSAIMIRTLQLDINGNLEIYVGASLVKGSNPVKEYEELQVKMKGVLNAISGKKASCKSFLREYYLDDEIQELVQLRNQNLSKTWFFKQENLINSKLKGKTCLIINNEDDFTNMIAHLLKLIGLKVEIKRFDKIDLNETLDYDVVLIGPGPGNPAENTEKNLKNLKIINFLQDNNKAYFGICLGHQLIARSKGYKIRKKNIPTQGEQLEIELFGKMQKVAYYNTFAAYDNGKEKNILKGKNFFSYQFHPESILTQNGLEILEKSLEELVK